ncbi:hypothetical protein Snoj_04230 [Streptomyces nojiriensis]|uniref:Uncharacterized protein n=1 Tax=Streptomyces nojiriensis TaxID=66374 RepID=A0ABQ3SEG4_9ACTN|nr:hypothetical protein [Streptomyces nojiriensis]QTI48156.1 hypothetical protein JYK04_06016 [Streptomyces nojiriensis]GGS25763.1 hypothetical protein GCM10010205_64700 [Streptomyces nojiriensis]GHI66505.1 hypothetical protein Snoj_04230 [Streptomyces nojiriensis]
MNVFGDIISWIFASPLNLITTFVGLIISAHLLQDWPGFSSTSQRSERRAERLAAMEAVRDATYNATRRAAEARQYVTRELAEASRLARRRRAEVRQQAAKTIEKAHKLAWLFEEVKERPQDRGRK